MYLVEVNCREQRPSLHVTLSSPCFLSSSSLSIFNKGKNPVVTKLRTDQIRVVIGWSGWMHTGSHVLLQSLMCQTGVWFLTLHLCRSHFFFSFQVQYKGFTDTTNWSYTSTSLWRGRHYSQSSCQRQHPGQWPYVSKINTALTPLLSLLKAHI